MTKKFSFDEFHELSKEMIKNDEVLPQVDFRDAYKDGKTIRQVRFTFFVYLPVEAEVQVAEFPMEAANVG